MTPKNRTVRNEWEGELFRLVVQNVHDYAIFNVDPEGLVISWGPGAEQLFGYRDHEIIGHSTDCLFTQEDIANGAPRQEMRDALAAGRVEENRTHVRKDGSVFLSSGTTTPFGQVGGGSGGFAKIVRERTDPKQSKGAMAYADNIIATLREPFVVLDTDWRVLTVNAAFHRQFHTTHEGTEGSCFFEWNDGQWNIPSLRMLLNEILSKHHPVENFQIEHTFAVIGRRDLLINARRFIPERHGAEMILLAIEDVTASTVAEPSATDADGEYRRLFQTARDGILILDESTGKIIDANPFMSELLGYEHARFLGLQLWEIGLFKDKAANQAAFRELQSKGYIRYDHLPLETLDKRKVNVEFVSNSYEVEGRNVIQCNIRDCSERIRFEQEIKASLEEKEVLLREVHHRVKNNLQVISSLLHLQSQHTQDQASVQMFRKSQSRVRSMALVHERLYRSKDLTQVDFTDYIESLARYLFSAHEVDTDRVSLDVDVRGVHLPIDAAVPCGLLLNELISNSLKHAFEGRERGQIRVEMIPVNRCEILLCVSDDGIGLPPSIEPQAGETFGMQLIADLVEQLHGAVKVERDGGTKIRVVFTIDDFPEVGLRDQP